LLGTLGVLGEVHELFPILVGTMTIGLLIYTVIAGRRAIIGDIAGDAAPESSRAIFARAWPWVMLPVLIALWIGIVIRELLYDFVPYGAVLFTIGVMMAVPCLDALLSREARRFQAAGSEIDAALAKGARIVLTVAAMAVAWRLNPFATAGGGLGAQVMSVLLQITITVLVAYAAWQSARIFIDKKIAEEDAELAELGIDVSEGEGGGTGLSRTRTVLPLIRRTIQLTLTAIAVMIIFGALGVDIAPLLAGARVIGLAIGFGSQTLVRDVVFGAFFLMDDAFRIAEYIDAGAVKGTVEKISIRSVRLRHHRGAVHTVPFGEIQTLTNFSRDWAIMKLTFNVPFDTNIDKVRKLMKRVGLALAEVEEIKEDFIQPFKSQGAIGVNDFGFVIATKFMSKPGKQFFIRRHAFNAVQKAFQENGIEFATPKVEVRVEAAAKEPAASAANAKVGAAAGAEMMRAAKPAAQ
jgi:small-conductance mechanosensitive channel